ncbi:DnaA/Hda family protein, partial [Vibrio sp. FNV 38]|nr:DnaA/Hda family protein [Vibrio sp. FNV 38]
LILTEPEALAGKELSSEKLFYILDDYLLRGQAIIAFADTPPFRIPKLMPRIRTQLEGGILLNLGRHSIGAIDP